MASPSGPASGFSSDVPDGRLDSWKAIAEYLGRDIRTVMRWEVERKLPIRRVPGGRGRTVFAFQSEIDAWLANTPNEDAAPATPPVAGPRHRPGPFRRLAFALTVMAVLVGSVALWRWSPRVERDAQAAIVRVAADAAGVTAWNAAGERLWFRAFSPDRRLMLTAEPAAVVRDLDGDGRAAVLVGVAQAVSAGPVDQGGELLVLSATGETKWRFVSDEHLKIGAGVFAGSWPIATWVAPDAGHAHTALAVHDFTWWPSILYVLDNRGGVAGKFVNAGWIGSVTWIDTPQGDRLVAGGISNSQSAGIVAVLDASRVNGRSPEAAGSEFECHNCPAGDPLAYFTFPRTELNEVAGASFNQARVFASPDGLTVRTEEVSPDVAHAGGGIEVIYQFTHDLKVKSASFGDRYWDLHRRLEQDGRIHHSRDQCPGRDGPREIRVWQPSGGWQTIALNRR